MHNGQLSATELASHGLFLLSVGLFMLGLMRMSRVRTARSGNAMAAAAMLFAVLGQLLQLGWIDPRWIALGLVSGAVIGGVAAARVQMTQMPEMVALLNGSGGLASALVALSQYVMLEPVLTANEVALAGAMPVANALALAGTILIGAVTFTGSVVAWAKLSGAVGSAPFVLPGRHLLNGGMALGAGVATGVLLWVAIPGAGWVALGAITVLTLALGIGLVLPIGGGDMPVVISLLNSYSGLAAAMAGFTLDSPVLIVSGSLVGAAGLILTQIMCRAMNRSLLSVISGGFGSAPALTASGEYTGVKRSDPEEAALIFEDARTCIIVPGYGMAVAQAQHAVRELGDLLGAAGCEVRYAIHPVAGRMPGHMNVLLAEADVPYECQLEMERINEDFKRTDVVLVVGANDVVNPAANDDPASPIYGMPVLKVEESATVFVIKRSLSPGFAGIKNHLFEADNTLMLFGDGKRVVEELVAALKAA